MHLNVYASKIGFTLAEVLITLGIIGVVAALTLPTLIQHHRKSVVETRLAKFYSIINQAVQMAEVEYGDKKSWTIDEEHNPWFLYIKPYVKVLETKTYDMNDGSKAEVNYLQEGSAFYIAASEYYFWPDAKKVFNADIPSRNFGQLGRDVFRFGFYPNNDLEPLKFHKNKGVEPYTGNWDGNPETLYSSAYYGCNNVHKEILPGTDVVGSYCTAVIQRNGWKIPEDYPFKF